MLFKNLLTVLLILTFLLAPSAYAGKVEYPSLYPSPNGDYQNLYSTNNSYFATASGHVGVGTATPQSKFTVQSASSAYNAGLFIGGSTAASILPYNGIVYYSVGTYYEAGNWLYYQNAGASILGLSETGGALWYSGTGASYSNVAGGVALWSAAGVFLCPSSRTLKENFTPLDSNDILQKIDQLEVTRWNYKSEGKSITHIGPVAEDFYRIFKAGDSEKKLAPSDSLGVALAGAKALSNKVKVQQQEIESLKSEIAELKRLKGLTEKTGKAL